MISFKCYLVVLNGHRISHTVGRSSQPTGISGMKYGHRNRWPAIVPEFFIFISKCRAYWFKTT
jgi:hypothetical protein